MWGIICAIHGGPDSQPTIEKGIALAKEVKLPLHFLYAVNLDFLSHTQSSKTSTISDQMTQMGEFIMLAAQEKAAAQGVDSQADIRHGNVREEIIETAKEMKADYFVLGLPVGYKIGYTYFLRKGFPAVLITVGLAFIWQLIRFA